MTKIKRKSVMKTVGLGAGLLCALLMAPDRGHTAQIPFSFSGSVWAYLGWTILAAISVLTIIGWAWVYVAWLRWFCRNIQGTRREVLFIGSGLEFLWRAIVAAVASIFIIPIPWVYRWMSQWLASQTVLAERGAHANA